MPSESGEIRYDRPDLIIDVHRLVHTLEKHGRVFFRYAAFGTLHCLYGFNSRLMAADYEVDRGLAEEGSPPTSPAERLWVGPEWAGPPGVGTPEENGHTLWIRQNDNKGTSAWLNRGGYHDPGYLVEKFLDRPSPVDALGLGVLFLLIEQQRGLSYDTVPTIERWIEVLDGERELPQFARELAGDAWPGS